MPLLHFDRRVLLQRGDFERGKRYDVPGQISSDDAARCVRNLDAHYVDADTPSPAKPAPRHPFATAANTILKQSITGLSDELRVANGLQPIPTKEPADAPQLPPSPTSGGELPIITEPAPLPVGTGSDDPPESPRTEGPFHCRQTDCKFGVGRKPFPSAAARDAHQTQRQH